ncbi:terminase small subunit, partial [Escherichia coli]|uniref:terminase small subunit n=1 Tax=Escherichia coli TaxID=562 RepID=UPI00202496B8
MLTTQKRKFALALMSGKNKTASAIAAGYSAKTARVKGSQLAKDPEVLAFVALSLKPIPEHTGPSANTASRLPFINRKRRPYIMSHRKKKK